MRIVKICALAIPLSMMGCGDDGGGNSGGDGGVPGVDADTSGGGGELTVPATVTMTAGFGGPIFAGICQTLQIGGGIGFTLQTAPQCPGGDVYLTWLKNTTGDTYSVIAGTILTENNDGAAVAIQSTSTGVVTKTVDDEDIVTDLTAGSDITIETAGHSPVTFSFTGDDLTVSAFTDR